MSVPFLFAQLIPKDYRPLLTAISPAAFSVVDWKQVLKDAPSLLRRFGSKDGVDVLTKTLSPLWGYSIQGVVTPAKSQSVPPALGQAVLELYFAQLFSDQGVFLDLRRRNFSLQKDQSIQFSPNGFWVQWSEPFRLGLLNIYDGYYENKIDQLDQGLSQVGLITPEMSQEKISEVRAMLLSHIGGDYQQQKFLIADFTASFEKFFQFLEKNQIRLSVDFLYLGIYLASLYHCLQEVGGAYNVQESFRKVRDNAKSK